MNKRIIKYFWALPLLGMLSGCSDSSVTENSQNASNVINFSVTTSKQSSSDGTTKSRATIVDNDAVRVPNSSFGLYAYSYPATTAATWAQWKATQQFGTPNFMNNQEVKYENGSWTYDPLKFWSSDKVSFFAYLPYNTSPLLNGATVTASAAANAMPQVEFTQVMDAEKMVDFIASNAIDKTRDDGVVTLDFKHVLTRLNFKARLDEELTGNKSTHIFIKELKICGTAGSTTAAGDPKANDASKLYNKATFVLGDGSGTGHEADGQWNYDAATPQATALDVTGLLPIKTTRLTSGEQAQAKTKDMEGAELKQNGDTIGLLKPTADLKQHYLFLIPPQGIQGIQSDKDVIVELKYDVITADPSLDEKFTPVDPRTVAISLPNGTLQQGKAYNIIFTVGLNPVKVDVNVTDWDKDEIEYAPEISAATPDKDGILNAWRSLNDTKKQDETANYFVIKVNKPTGNLDLRSAVNAETDFAAFKLGDQVELLFTDEDGSYDIANNVLVPNGWYCEDREVNHVKRHIISKVANYKTEVSADFDNAKIRTALKNLNDAHTDAIHYYAVDIYSAAPSSLDLSAVVPSTELNNLKSEKDYVYIIFNAANDSGDTALTAPEGWELVKVTTGTNLCKYRLQQKTSSQTSNVAIGNTGFVAGSTINVNK